jgi:hypothetical protein
MRSETPEPDPDANASVVVRPDGDDLVLVCKICGEEQRAQRAPGLVVLTFVDSFEDRHRH